MSKIFEAYKKRSGNAVDLVQEVSRAGSIALFPPPTEAQQADFNRLANRILGQRMENRGTVLGFASTSSGEGASFVSYHAAANLASVYHQNVAWLDGNFLSPQAKLSGREFMTLATLLQDPGQVADLTIDTNPYLIPAGGNLLSKKGLFADEKYADLLRQLSRRFDFVIVDMPPVQDTSETSLMAARCDGTLLVIEQKFLKWEIIESGLKTLKEKNVTVLGSVINRRQFVLPKVIYDRL